jgi:hypothetical protein
MELRRLEVTPWRKVTVEHDRFAGSRLGLAGEAVSRPEGPTNSFQAR